MRKVVTLIFVFLLISGHFNLMQATTCAQAVAVPAAPTFPWVSSLTCGTSNDINSTNATSCGTSYYLGGYEAVYVWTPGNDYINVTFAYSGQTWSGLMLYQGCPTAGGTCMAYLQSSSSSKTLSTTTGGGTISLTNGVTYYLVIDTWPTPQTPCPGTITINGTISVPCTTPLAQPTNLALTPLTTSINGTFTVAAGSDSYLVVRTTDATLSELPVDGTTYTVGGTLGNGTIAAIPTTGTFSASGLTAATLYYFHIFSMNSQCSGGPLYLTTDPLTGSITTAPNPPASLTATAASSSQIDLVAIANVAGNDVMVAWSLTNTFGIPTGAYNPGDPITGGGTVLYSGPAAGLPNHTGLTQGTRYYYMAWSVAGGTYSSSTVGANAITLCTNPYPVPYLQNFQAGQDPPACWTEAQGVLAAPTTFTSTTSSNWWVDDWRNITSGNKAGALNIWSTGRYEWLISPPITLGGDVYQLEFDLTLNAFGTSNAPQTTGTDDKFAIIISTDGGTTWTSANTLRLYDNAGSPYVYNNINPNGEHVILSLAAYSGTILIGFYGESTVTNADNDLMIDNVSVGPVPQCNMPIGLSYNDLRATSVRLNWTPGGTEALWNVKYGAPGFNPLTEGTLVAGLSSPSYSLTGLSPTTSYDWYVQADCGSGVTSTWGGPGSFTTTVLCPAPTLLTATTITTTTADLGWTENGEASLWDIEFGPAGFTPTGNPTDPQGIGVTNPVTWTGLTPATNYSYYVRANCGGGNGTSTWVGPKTFSTQLCEPVDQCTYTVDLTDAYGDGWNGNILGFKQGGVVVATFGEGFTTGTSYGPVNASLCDDQTTEIVVVTLGSWTTEVGFVVKDPWGAVVFTYNAGTSFTGTTIFHTFTSNCVPVTCPKPTALGATPASTTANLFWTPGGSEANWEYVYGASPLAPPVAPGTASTSATTNPISGLNPATNYQFYVRAICGAGDTSTWAGPYSFTTQCSGPVTTYPYTQDFSAGLVPPTCWSLDVTNAGFTWKASTTNPGAADVEYDPALVPQDEWLISQAFDFTTLAHPRLRFNWSMSYYWAVDPNNNYDLNCKVSTDGGSTWTLLWTEANAGVFTNWTVYTATLDLLTYAGLPNVILAWQYIGTDGAQAVIDNIFVDLWEPLAVTGTPTDITCFGGSDGAITTTVTGGTSPYAYLWSNGATTASLTGLSAGTYGVTVTDALAATATGTWTVNQPNEFFLSAVVTPASCPTATDGAIDLTVTGVPGPFVFLWSNGATTEDLSALAPGTYDVTVYSPNNCMTKGDSYAVSVDNPVCDYFTLTGAASSTVCYNAVVTLTVENFAVTAPGSVELIAAGNIVMLPGTIVTQPPAAPGAYLWGHITTNSSYCAPADAPAVALASGREKPGTVVNHASFNLFPNPTNGNFTLVQKGETTFGNVKIEIFSMSGSRVMTGQMTGEKQHEFNASVLPAGIYFVKAIADGYVETIKLVKTR